MLEFTIKYVAKWQLQNNTNYVFTKCGLCYNCKTGRLIKQVLKNQSIGYIINGKFKTLQNLKKQLIVIPKKQINPF